MLPRVLTVCCLVILVPAALGQEVKTALAIEDLYRFEGPRWPVFSKDGQRLAYVRQWIDAAAKQERHSLWLVEGKRDNARPLEQDQPDARSPLWSPDGKWLVFLSTRPRPAGWKQTPTVPPESDAATDIWLIPAGGGAAIPLAGPDKPYGRVFSDGFYGRLAFAPDGQRLVFVADDGKDPRTPQEIANDVEIVRPDQGEGYTGYGPAQVWVAHLDAQPGKWAASRIDRLTSDDIWYGDPQWSPDGQVLAVHANKTADRESVRYSINKNYDIWLIDAASKKQHKLTSGPGPEVSPRFARDGRQLACLSIPRKGSHRDVFNLTVITLVQGGSFTEVLFDQHRLGEGKPPHPAPVFPLPEDCWDETGLFYQAEGGLGGGLAHVDLATGQGRFLHTLAKEPLASKSSFLQGRSRQLPLAPAGNLFMRQRLQGPQEVVRWSNEGFEIEAVFTRPPQEIARPPYKLVVYPHGGPHSRAGLGFDFTVQIFAANGYAVLQPNFRGSAGYGQKFINADRYDLGGGDMRDILTGVDQLVKKGVVDRDRQFLYGISYGGFMTCWMVGQTNQFRAAVAQNAVTDLNMMWGLSDLQSWTHWEFGGFPWEVPAAMHLHSPLAHVAKVTTPTMILHSSKDRRCPLPMGRAFHQALLARKVPTQMVIYPDEGHGIRQPRHREDVLRRTLAWFGQHDQKK